MIRKWLFFLCSRNEFLKGRSVHPFGNKGFYILDTVRLSFVCKGRGSFSSNLRKSSYRNLWAVLYGLLWLF